MVFKKILLVGCLFMAFNVAAQNNIILKGDTLILPNGSKFWLGQEVTLGNGSAPDKTFNFIYQPELLYIKKRKPLNASFYAKKAIIKKFQKDANYKNTYAYNIIVLDFGDKKKYWCDVQGALDNNEIINSSGISINYGNRAENKEAKLLRLKKLYDDGDITKDEYEILKNKILNDKSKVKQSYKANNGPVVF